MDKTLIISKLEAVKRQLETSILMYFHSGDPISIHTLTAASYNVLRDINKRKSGDPMLKEKLLEYVKPAYKKQFHDKLAEAENFLKHADRDHNKTLTFNLFYTEILILEVCIKYTELTDESPPLFQVYRAWFMGSNSHVYEIPENNLENFKEIALVCMANGKEDFFKLLLPAAMKKGNESMPSNDLPFIIR